MSGETESPAPSGFQAAFVLDHGNGFLDGVTTSVAFVVCGSAEGNVLADVEQVGWDADLAMTALFIFDGQVRRGFGRPICDLT